MIKYHKKDYGSVVVNKFRDYLWGEKKVEERTIDAYCIAVRSFCKFLGIINEENIKLIDGISVRNYIESLKHDEYVQGKKYLASSINIKIVAMNHFLEYYELSKLKVRQLKIQKKIFIDDKEMLTDLDVSKLLSKSEREDYKLYCIFRALIQMGIRVSETKYITYESINGGYISIDNKGTYREVPIPDDLKIKLLDFCLKERISSGYVFVDKNGKPIDRTIIARKMKKIGNKLKINVKKLHPHNFRHFFALKFIKVYGEAALSVLSDILGHKSIETTRIYLKQSLSKLSSKMTLEKLKIAS